MGRGGSKEVAEVRGKGQPMRGWTTGRLVGIRIEQELVRNRLCPLRHMTATESCRTLHGVRIIFSVQAESVMFSGLFSFVFQTNFYFLEKHLQEASMSKCKPISTATILAYWLLSGTIVLYGQQAKPETSIENIFQMGLMAQDTNGDQIADAICGHVIVPKSPSAAENTAAANLAARFGYETTALTLPIVVTTTGQATKSCPSEKANLWVGREALPAGAAAIAD
jgi:hypothetical protein